MTKKTKIVKNLILLAATSLGAATLATAQTTGDEPAVEPRHSLLGERYAGVDFVYTHVHDTPFDNVNGFALNYHQPMKPGFDFSLGYEWGRSNMAAGNRVKQQEFTASLTAYSDYNGMRPFIEPGVGWNWAKFGPAKADSFFYFVGAGVEFQVSNPWVVTPYTQFVDATDYSGSTWNFGVKSSYRLNASWSAKLDVSVDDDRNTGLSVGLNYHF